MRLPVMLLITALFTSSCYYPSGGHMMDDWGHMSWGYGGVFMWLLFLVLIGVVVYFVVRGEKWMRRGGGDETALDILNKRYAKGEITEQEYKKMKKEME
jgi:putative membrane protein